MPEEKDRVASAAPVNASEPEIETVESARPDKLAFKKVNMSELIAPVDKPEFTFKVADEPDAPGNYGSPPVAFNPAGEDDPQKSKGNTAGV